MWRRTDGANHAQTYYLGQTTMISFDLVRDVPSLDERRPKQYEGIGRTRDVRSILPFVFVVVTGWTKRRRTRWRHDEHRRRRRGARRHRKDWFVTGHWTRLCNEGEAHTRIRVVDQWGQVILNHQARGTRGQLSESEDDAC
jgi:hypothetical protein